MKASEFGGHVPEFVGEWSFNQTSDIWTSDHFPSREDAIAEGRAEYGPAEGFSVGFGAEIVVPCPDADDIIQIIASRVYDTFGEVAEDYLANLPKEASDDLTAALRKTVGEWLTRHNLWPTFCDILGIESVPPEEPNDAPAEEVA